MDYKMDDIPLPRPQMIIIIGFTWIFKNASMIHHDQVNTWLATIVGSCGVVKYGYDFYKWRFKKRK